MSKNLLNNNKLNLVGIDHIQAGIFDLNGLMRGKRLPTNHYSKIMNNGIKLPLSAQNIDIYGSDIKNSKFVFATGDKDGTATCQGAPQVILKHLSKPVLVMPLGLKNCNGELFEGCPRAFLKKVMKRAHSKNFVFKCGVELEFCLFSENLSSPILSEPELLSLLALDSVDDFIRDIRQITEQLEVKIESMLSEAGKGQIEIALSPCPDLCKLADAILILKHSLTAYTQARGLLVSFAAKPKKNLSGNGLHCHISLENRLSENLFAKDEALFNAAIAATLKLLEPATAIMAPLPESYNRLQRNSHAPLNIGWGFDNRTVAVRIPRAAPEATRLELRVAGADSNPYFLFSVLVSFLLAGIEDMLVPPPPVFGNGYEADLKLLPHDLKTALSIFENSEQMRRMLPPTLREMFIATKKQEIRKQETRLANSGDINEKEQ